MWSGWLSKNERGVCLADCVWAEATLLGRTLSCVWQEAPASPVQGLKKLCKMCPFIINTMQNMGLLKFLTKTSVNKSDFFCYRNGLLPLFVKASNVNLFWLNHFVICSNVTHKDYSANLSRKVIESRQFHDQIQIRSMIFDDFQKYRSHLMSGASPWTFVTFCGSLPYGGPEKKSCPAGSLAPRALSLQNLLSCQNQK